MAKTVAVIGAGAAGLCALRHLSAYPTQFKAVGFERYGYIGGTWVYTDRTGIDEDGLPVHTSMYKNLRTNLPKQLMAFHDFPFQNLRPSFARHEEIYEYLKAYCDRFQLEKNIKFGTLVTNVRPLTPGNRDTRWEVTYRHVAEGKSETLQFDAVLVCNGHFTVPYLPEIAGSDLFTGSIIHTHDYRVPDVYKDQTVVCLGAGFSGLDVCVELSETAKKILLSHDDFENQIKLPENAFHRRGIQRLTEKTVIFTDGEEEEIDAVILCTGYRYSFPFLADSCEVTLQDKDKRVAPLYKHMIHAKYPSLAFIGLPQSVIQFSMFEIQTQFMCRVLDGSLELLSEEEMLIDTENEFEERLGAGSPKRRFHCFHMFQFPYYDELSEMAGIPRISESRRNLYVTTIEHYFNDIITYKDIMHDCINVS